MRIQSNHCAAGDGPFVEYDDTGAGDEQRHVQRLLPDTRAVLPRAVLAERLAVIGGQYKQRVLQVPPRSRISALCTRRATQRPQ